MCGRFTLAKEYQELAEELGVPVEDLLSMNWHARWNVAPMQRAPIVVLEGEERHAIEARWGFTPRWFDPNKKGRKPPRPINARSETVATSRLFQGAFSTQRCTVPADGFYEWSGPKSDRIPHWIHRAVGGVMLFAGLYETWHPPDQEEPETTFTILTTDCNALIEPIHDRMPVVLDDAGADEWMWPDADLADLQRLLVPAAADLLVMQNANPLVNSVRNEGADLLST